VLGTLPQLHPIEPSGESTTGTIPVTGQSVQPGMMHVVRTGRTGLAPSWRIHSSLWEGLSEQTLGGEVGRNKKTGFTPTVFTP
jgi:hypothetical protein